MFLIGWSKKNDRLVTLLYCDWSILGIDFQTEDSLLQAPPHPPYHTSVRSLWFGLSDSLEVCNLKSRFVSAHCNSAGIILHDYNEGDCK